MIILSLLTMIILKVYDFLHICLFMWTNVTILFSQLSHLNDCLFGWTQLCFFTSFILRRFPHLRHGNLWKPRFPRIFCRDHISSRKIPVFIFFLSSSCYLLQFNYCFLFSLYFQHLIAWNTLWFLIFFRYYNFFYVFCIFIWFPDTQVGRI